MATRHKSSSLEESAVRAQLAAKGSPKAMLPSAEAPALEGLVVDAPLANAVSQDELVLRFEALKREHAQRRERAPGETLKLGDDVTVDVLAYCGGKLVPFSPRFDDLMTLEPMAHLPGFSENLAGLEVGKSAKVALIAPADSPTPALRGQQLDFIVDIKRAFEVTLPKDSAPAFLAKTGRGKTVDEVMDSLAKDAAADEVDRVALEVQDRVLDELAERVKVELPAEVVNEAIRLRWFAREGRQLVHKGFDQAEQDEALAGWVKDDGVRLETVRGLRIDVALEALRVAHSVEVTRAAFDTLLAELAPSFGLTVEALKAEAKQDPQVARQLAELAQRAATVSFVMSKVTIREPT